MPAASPGLPIDFRRGKTAKKLLEIDWAYPVWKPKPTAEDQGPARTSTENLNEHALPVEQAYAYIAADDPRPLLVMRECERCKGTDHALLTRAIDNEQTIMITRWFHCVKLPPNVLGKDHPFTNLFAKEEPDERLPHLFFADPDGSNKRGLPGDQSQTQLWETMFSYLDRCYEGDAKKSLKQMRQLLSQLDHCDLMEQELKNKMDRELEKNGPKSARLKSMEAEVKKYAKDRERLLEKEKELRNLALKSMREKPVVGAQR
jgi:hypothetical protein